MMVRETTDHASPLAIERYSAGFRTPLLTSAGGRVYLAYCARVAARNAHRHSGAVEQGRGQAGAAQRAELAAHAGEIKAQGYATATRTPAPGGRDQPGVPVLLNDRVLAALTVRFAASAVPLKTGAGALLAEAAPVRG